MTESTQACPECDSSTITPRSGRGTNPRTTDPDADWRCKVCGARFDRPVEREKHVSGGSRPGLAGALEAAHPSEVGR